MIGRPDNPVRHVVDSPKMPPQDCRVYDRCQVYLVWLPSGRLTVSGTGAVIW